MKVIENKYCSIVDDEQVQRKLEKVKEYDKDGIHYVEYNDGTCLSTASTNTYNNWKTKKDYVKHMNWFNKILYYLWIIILYKDLPIKQSGHLINNEPFLQTCQGSTYSSYWHWNYYNPLTYIVIILFVIFMLIMNIFISIFQIFKMTKIVKINIEDP